MTPASQIAEKRTKETGRQAANLWADFDDEMQTTQPESAISEPATVMEPTDFDELD